MTRIGGIVKSKISKSAVSLLDEKGYFGTGLNEILARAKTSKGSAYRQFPGGKDEIVLYAIQDAQTQISAAMKDIFSLGKDPISALRASSNYLKQLLIDGKFASGCPIAAVGLELSGSDSAASKACKNAFQEWKDLLEHYFSGHVSPKESERLSDAIFCMFQGALVLSRISGDTVHLDNASDFSVKLFLLASSSPN